MSCQSSLHIDIGQHINWVSVLDPFCLNCDSKNEIVGASFHVWDFAKLYSMLTILALLADTVIEFQEQAIADDELGASFSGVAESSVLCSAAAPSFGRTTHGQLEAMAKAYKEVY
ncbi:hypothetical protein D5086_020075 [Populus alba]|uniref:Uncharacterized protein n=1 Tax=Populus alba TaxID=43335 RepID=A0ACC4BKP8_POPAL